MKLSQQRQKRMADTRNSLADTANTEIAGDQKMHDVTGLVGTDAGFVVTWSSLQDGGGYGVYGQLYDSQGVAVGDEFRVNTYISSTQYEPSVT